MKTQIIGFTNKYYTLWEVHDTIINIDSSRYKTRTWYKYKQNLSFDFATAVEKAGTDLFNPTLKATKSWYKDSEPKMNLDFNIREHLLSFGKYKGRTIDDLIKTDLNYLEWLSNEIWGTELREAIKSLPELKEFLETKEIKTAEELEKIIPLSPNVPITFELIPQKNLKIDGPKAFSIYESPEKPKLKLWLYFDNFETFQYEGFEYGLPRLLNKAKRIKGKTIRVMVIPAEAINIKNRWGVSKQQDVEVVDWELVQIKREKPEKVKKERKTIRTRTRTKLITPEIQELL